LVSKLLQDKQVSSIVKKEMVKDLELSSLADEDQVEIGMDEP
jgi:hypothetical protein